MCEPLWIVPQEIRKANVIVVDEIISFGHGAMGRILEHRAVL